MFDFIRYVWRNPSEITRGTRKLSSVRRAMRKFRAEHTECAWCGRTRKLEVHHIVPVSVSPKMADDQRNMIMLCRKPACHQVIGHNGDFRSRYVENVRDVCSGAGHQVIKTISL